MRLAGELRGDDAAQTIQRHMAYASEPPFDSGTPETAPPAILEKALRSARAITAQREQTARRIAAKLGVAVPAEAMESPVGGSRVRRERRMDWRTRHASGARLIN